MINFIFYKYYAISNMIIILHRENRLFFRNLKKLAKTKMHITYINQDTLHFFSPTQPF